MPPWKSILLLLMLTQTVCTSLTVAQMRSVDNSAMVEKIHSESYVFRGMGIMTLDADGSVAIRLEHSGDHLRCIELQLTENAKVRQGLEIGADADRKLASLREEFPNELRTLINNGLRNGTIKGPQDGNALVATFVEETRNELEETLSPKRMRQLEGIQKRYSHRLLGWPQIIRQLESIEEVGLAGEQKRVLEDVLKEQRQIVDAATKEFYAETYAGIVELLEKKMADELTDRARENLQSVTLPLELMMLHLRLTAEKNTKIANDPMSISTGEYEVTPTGRLELNESTSNAYWTFLNSIISASGGQISPQIVVDMQREIRDPSTPLGEAHRRYEGELQKMQMEMMSNPKSIEVHQQEFIKKMDDDRLRILKEFESRLEPQQRRELDIAYTRMEIRIIGVTASLAWGRLSKHLKVTPSEREKIEAFAASRLQAAEKLAMKLELDTMNEVRQQLTPDQVHYLDQRFACFDKSTLIEPTPTLPLLNHR